MRKISVAVSVLTLAASAAAQNTTVVPSLYATVEAETVTTRPLGQPGPCRLQYLYDASLVAVPAMVIRSVALRGDGSRPALAKAGVDIEILMSTTTIPWFSPNTTFASNHGANVSSVFTRKVVNLPAQSGSKTPAPFETPFPLDVPFVYLRPLGNLLIDYIVRAQPAGPYTHDASYTYAASFTRIGSACGGLSQSVIGGSASSLTATIIFVAAGGPSGGVALHAIGARQLPSPIVLPFGGCLLHQSIQILSPMIQGNGSTMVVTYPLHPTFKGFVLFGQSLALDPALTRLAASESHQVVLGGFDPHARIQDTTSASTPAGTVELGYGIVIELTY